MMIDMDDPSTGTPQARQQGLHAPTRPRQRAEDRDTCDAIIDTVCERGECDFVNDIAAPLPMILIGDMLGVEPETAAICSSGRTTW